MWRLDGWRLCWRRDGWRLGWGRDRRCGLLCLLEVVFEVPKVAIIAALLKVVKVITEVIAAIPFFPPSVAAEPGT